MAVMNEVGIDHSGRSPQLLTRELAEWADIVVTMGCGDQCPVVPGVGYVDWELSDPAGRPVEEVRVTRDEIEHRVTGLLAGLDTAAVEHSALRQWLLFEIPIPSA
jgi:arsenate reductase